MYFSVSLLGLQHTLLGVMLGLRKLWPAAYLCLVKQSAVVNPLFALLIPADWGKSHRVSSPNCITPFSHAWAAGPWAVLLLNCRGAPVEVCVWCTKATQTQEVVVRIDKHCLCIQVHTQLFTRLWFEIQHHGETYVILSLGLWHHRALEKTVVYCLISFYLTFSFFFWLLL